MEVVGSEGQDLRSSQQLAYDDTMAVSPMQAAPDGSLQLLKKAASAEVFLDTADQRHGFGQITCFRATQHVITQAADALESVLEPSKISTSKSSVRMTRYECISTSVSVAGEQSVRPLKVELI